PVITGLLQNTTTNSLEYTRYKSRRVPCTKIYGNRGNANWPNCADHHAVQVESIFSEFPCITQNIKSTLKSTIDSLRDVCPLKVSSEIISKSLHDILCNDKVFREQSKGSMERSRTQNVAILACDVVTCLGGNYKELYAIKERLDNAIIEKWTDKPTLEVKNKNYENQIQSPKRKHDDLNFCKMLKFVRDILKEVNEMKKGFKQKIIKLALREDEDLIQIWRAVKTTECRRKQSHKFIDFVNLAFNLNLKCIGTEVKQSKFYSDSPEAKQVMYMVTIVDSA
ncbi:11776_t:CDS:2, partial [Cetraspora pellucida]